MVYEYPTAPIKRQNLQTGVKKTLEEEQNSDEDSTSPT